jgi:uncharacterized protein with HEPN domain
MSADAWRARVRDILAAVANVERLTAGMDVEAFREHPSVLPATLYYLTVIGEAATRVPEALVVRHPAVPWADMRAQRNFIVHRYGEVDPDVVWDTLRNDIPALEPLLRAMLELEA